MIYLFIFVTNFFKKTKDDHNFTKYSFVEGIQPRMDVNYVKITIP